MFQIDNATAATSQPASTSPGTPGFFTDGNALTGVSPTVVPAEWLNAVMMELCNVITGAGLALSKSTFNQVLTAIKRLGQKSIVLTDTGAANTYVAANSPALVAADLGTGLLQQVSIKTTNNGASTYSPDGLTAKPIYGLGLQPLQGGELVANGVAVLMYLVAAGVNSGNGAWILMECAGGAQQVPNGTQSQHSVALGQIAQAIGTTAAQFDSSLKLATTAFVKTAGESFGGIKSVSGAATLDATYAGQLTVFTGTTYACTLPAASTYPAGATLTFYSAASGAVTLNRASTDVISVNNATSLTSMVLNSGDTLTLVSNGANAWEAQAGSAQLGYAGVFGSSLAASGYQKLPGGLILQWGLVVSSSSGDVTWTFPTAFTTTVYQMYSSAANTGSAYTTIWNSGGLTSANVGCWNGGSRVASASVACFAIGK